MAASQLEALRAHLISQTQQMPAAELYRVHLLRFIEAVLERASAAVRSDASEAAPHIAVAVRR